MKTAPFHKNILIALVVVLVGTLFPSSAHAAQITRRVVVVIPPPVVSPLKKVVSR